jgi:2-methylcitrate dehydratase PrpD
VLAVERFAQAMGPRGGPSQVLIARRSTSPYFAAMVNAAASHVVEQDDVHNSSVFHPATVVFPPALAVAQAENSTGRELLAAVVAGYEVGIRVGEFLGRSHYKVFHTTGTAGVLAAAAATGRLLRSQFGADGPRLRLGGHAGAGLWEFLRDGADSKQLHTAHAAAAGLASAYLARDGFTGAQRILDGAQGMAAGMSQDADPAGSPTGSASRWALAETSFKYHASCRHTHPAADALQQVMHAAWADGGVDRGCLTHVHQGAIDVLGPVVEPRTVHQSKFSMGTVLALIALRHSASLDEFETALDDAAVAAFRDKVTMVLDTEVDSAYPARWIGKVTVHTTDGRTLHGRVDEPKGDPGQHAVAHRTRGQGLPAGRLRRRRHESGNGGGDRRHLDAGAASGPPRFFASSRPRAVPTSAGTGACRSPRPAACRCGP